MTKNQEGLDPKDPEAEGLADQTPSDEGGKDNLSEQGTQNGGISREEYETLLSEIRGVQGKLDKDMAHAEKRLKGQFEELTERLGLELTPEQKQEYRMYQLEQQVESLKPKDAEPATEQRKPSAKFAEVFETLGISEPSDDDIRLAMQHADNPVKLAAELTRRQLNKPSPTPGTSVVPGRAKAPVQNDVDALLKEYDKYDGMPLSAELPGGKTVMQRREEIANELEELEQKK